MEGGDRPTSRYCYIHIEGSEIESEERMERGEEGDKLHQKVEKITADRESMTEAQKRVNMTDTGREQQRYRKGERMNLIHLVQASNHGGFLAT